MQDIIEAARKLVDAFDWAKRNPQYQGGEAEIKQAYEELKRLLQNESEKLHD